MRRDSVEEAMGEAPVSTEQPQTREEARVPAPDVDASRKGHSVGSASQGPSAPVGLILPIRDRATFIELRKSRLRLRRGALMVTWVPGSAGQPARVGYAISRKTGNAVVRNRIRRRLRAAARECRADLQGGAYLLGATPEAASVPFAELCASLGHAATTLARELGARDQALESR